MLYIPENIREEDERLFLGYIENMDKYKTLDQYMQEHASEEYLNWVLNAKRYKKEAWEKEHRKV